MAWSGPASTIICAPVDEQVAMTPEISSNDAIRIAMSRSPPGNFAFDRKTRVIRMPPSIKQAPSQPQTGERIGPSSILAGDREVPVSLDAPRRAICVIDWWFADH